MIPQMAKECTDLEAIARDVVRGGSKIGRMEIEIERSCVNFTDINAGPTYVSYFIRCLR